MKAAEEAERRQDVGHDEDILRVEGLVKHFPIRSGLLRRQVGRIHAVDGVDLTVRSGETLGVVGESGCGKSTLARTIIRLIEPTAGRIVFGGEEITAYDRNQLRKVRRNMQFVFQDPFASLDPRMTVRKIVAEPLRIHGLYEEHGDDRVRELLEIVHLSPE